MCKGVAMIWILIIMMHGAPGDAVTTVTFKSERACHAAAMTVLDTTPNRLGTRVTCVKSDD